MGFQWLGGRLVDDDEADQIWSWRGKVIFALIIIAGAAGLARYMTAHYLPALDKDIMAFVLGGVAAMSCVIAVRPFRELVFGILLFILSLAILGGAIVGILYLFGSG
jgi:hypothetical protein